MLTQYQITALAREYAEDDNPITAHRTPTERDWDIQIDADSAERVIRFLLRRFCLVEKSKATELCRLTLDHGDSVDYGLIDSLTDIVCDIFSEQYQQVAENKSTNPEI